MSDSVSAILSAALDHAVEAPEGLDHAALAGALAASAARRDALARAGMRVDESPYLHFLRRFAAEPVAPDLAASA